MLYKPIIPDFRHNLDIITLEFIGWHGKKRGVIAAASIDIIEYELLYAAYSFEL